MEFNHLNASKARRERAEFSAFRFLIKTPGDLSTGIVLPAAADILVSYSLTTVANTALVDVGTRIINIPALLANTKIHVGYFTRSFKFIKHAAVAGTVSIYVRDTNGRSFKIGQA